ncbi:glycoside hydrolase family 18 protein [Candidatus Microgenomates bacterium]|nr:glycoside hydrolase family 18 protein [Candidatus Microgenomates bacterium]
MDIDWEPLPVSQKELFGSFITDLKAAMNAQMQGSILLVTTMIGDMDQVIPSMAAIDQYNIQTYIMSGPWDGWVTWHASPLYSGTYTFPSNGAPLPSIERSVNALVSKGVPKAKIGVGSKWSGAKWTGVNAPLQSWTTPPAWQDDIPFYSLMDANYPAANNKWDDVAKVPYISIDGSGTTQDQFISYENEQSLTEKINYIKSSGIGGMIIWELNSGYRANLPAGQRNPLLSAIKTAVGGGTVISPTGTNSCSTKLGDANGDNEITLADYAVWRKAFIGKQ